MKVLVIGGTHFIGREIVRRLADAGHAPTLFNRGKSAPDSPWPTIKGDVEALAEYRAELSATRPEAVIHCIANTEQNARDAVDVFAEHDAHLIVLSSQDSYEAFQGAVRQEDASDFPYDEDAPLSRVRYYRRRPSDSPQASLYDKNLMTQVLMEAGRAGLVRPTVFRLPMVYGPHDPQYAFRHGPILHHVRDRRTTFVMGLREQGNLWTHGYVEKIAAGVVHALAHPETQQRIFNLGERHVRTRRRWADLYAQAAGTAFHYRLVPDELLAGEADAKSWPATHLIADCTRYDEETGFVAPVPLETAIERTLAWGLKHPDTLGPAPDYAREEQLADAFDAMITRMHAARPETP